MAPIYSSNSRLLISLEFLNLMSSSGAPFVFNINHQVMSPSMHALLLVLYE